MKNWKCHKINEQVVDIEDMVDTPVQEATLSDVATSSAHTVAQDLVRSSTFSEMRSEMCVVIASLVRDARAVKAIDVIIYEERDVAVLCLVVTAVDFTATDGPVRFAVGELRL